MAKSPDKEVQFGMAHAVFLVFDETVPERIGIETQCGRRNHMNPAGFVTSQKGVVWTSRLQEQCRICAAAARRL